MTWPAILAAVAGSLLILLTSFHLGRCYQASITRRVAKAQAALLSGRWQR
jgi:membrane protein DedA with SNARE-associated domain